MVEATAARLGSEGAQQASVLATPAALVSQRARLVVVRSTVVRQARARAPTLVEACRMLLQRAAAELQMGRMLGPMRLTRQ